MPDDVELVSEPVAAVALKLCLAALFGRGVPSRDLCPGGKGTATSADRHTPDGRAQVFPQYVFEKGHFRFSTNEVANTPGQEATTKPDRAVGWFGQVVRTRTARYAGTRDGFGRNSRGFGLFAYLGTRPVRKRTRRGVCVPMRTGCVPGYA